MKEVKNNIQAWETRTYSTEDQLKSSAWIEGYFGYQNLSAANADERIWFRNFQELYTRDKTLAALGDIGGRKGLDIGGGSGDYSILLALMGAKMSSQDLSSAATATGRKYARDLDVHVDFTVGDAKSLHHPDNSFDFCLSTDFFEHITDEDKCAVISEIYRVLKPGGIAVIKTPNLSYLRATLWLKRLLLLLRGRSPIVFIPHTRNNPDNEHHGLTTFQRLEAIITRHFFLDVERIPLALRRKGVPSWLRRQLYGYWPLTEHVVLKFQKSIVVPIGDDLHGRAQPD